jgi:putative two-component system response regulator
MTTLGDRQDRIEGIEAGADDFLPKPIDFDQLRARIRSLLKAKHFSDDLDSAEEVILNLARTVEARDPSTQGHCERLAAYAASMARELGLTTDQTAVLRRGAVLHDVGKIGVPDAILLKDGPLTAAEFEVMKKHTVVGEQLCADFKALRPVRTIVRHHHERLDGSGYPDGLVGAEIPLLAQIVGVVDVLDALTTARPYKPAITFEAAFACLRQEAARGLHDPALVDALVRLHKRGRLGCRPPGVSVTGKEVWR